jgi:hypothetical protein
MPIVDFDVNGRVRKYWGLIDHEVVVLVNPTKPIDYTRMCAHGMVTHATSYNVLVGRVVLYP